VFGSLQGFLRRFPVPKRSKIIISLVEPRAASRYRYG
jgi:hypothetical protein